MSTVPSLCFKTSTAASVRYEASELIHKFNTAIQSIKCGESKDPFAALSQALGDASAQSARVTLPSMVRYALMEDRIELGFLPRSRC